MPQRPATCSVTDLPKITCGCDDCINYRPSAAELHSFALTHEPDSSASPVWVRRLHYHSAEWTEAEPQQVVCDHGKPVGMRICPDCAATFARLLHDVRAVMTELDLCLTKQTGFLEHGAPKLADPDESSLPWNEGASKVIRRLFAALEGRPTRRAAELLDDWDKTLRREDLESLVSRVSAAVASAHQLVDSPAVTTYYGPCPTCQVDIYTEHVPKDGMVTCRACGYTSPREPHLQRQLRTMSSRQMRLGNVVRALNDAGIRASRQDVENLIYREGLPREQVDVPPHWVGEGAERRLVGGDVVWVYRMGDVLAWLGRTARFRHLSDNPPTG